MVDQELIDARRDPAKRQIMRRQDEAHRPESCGAGSRAIRRKRASGLPSGSFGQTLTLGEIFGRTMSPAMKRSSSGQCRQACSGAWPRPITTRQLFPPMSISVPSAMRWKRRGIGTSPGGHSGCRGWRIPGPWPRRGPCGGRRESGSAAKLASSRSTLIIRPHSHSPSVVQSGTPQRCVSQPARPIWSGWKCVVMTRLTFRPPSAVAKTCSQIARVDGESMPVSMIVQPSPSLSSHKI